MGYPILPISREFGAKNTFALDPLRSVKFMLYIEWQWTVLSIS